MRPAFTIVAAIVLSCMNAVPYWPFLPVLGRAFAIVWRCSSRSCKSVHRVASGLWRANVSEATNESAAGHGLQVRREPIGTDRL